MTFIKRFDLFGIHFIIPFQQKTKYNTFLGLLVTLFLTVFGALSFSYFGRNMFYKQNPKVLIQNSKIDIQLKRLNFKEHNVFFVLGIFSEIMLDHVLDESIYSATVNIYRQNAKGVVTKKFKLQPCNLEMLSNYELMQNYFKGKDIKKYFCLTQEQVEMISLVGEISHHAYETMYIELTKCKNITNHTCAPQEKIDKILKNVWIHFLVLKKTIDKTNYENPIQNYVELMSFTSTAKTHKYLHGLFSITELNTDKGLS